MARRTFSIDEKIDEAQKKVDTLKHKLEVAQSNLDSLIVKKNEEKKNELWVAIEKSGKSIDEIMDLVK